jgi:hypothetical protein
MLPYADNPTRFSGGIIGKINPIKNDVRQGCVAKRKPRTQRAEKMLRAGPSRGDCGTLSRMNTGTRTIR